MDLSHIPLIDNHCHPPHRVPPRNELELKRYFTEAYDPRMVESHVQHSAFYRQAVRLLAALLDLPSDAGADDVLASRNGMSLPDYLALLVERANVKGLVVDYGFPAEESYSQQETAELFEGIPCRLNFVLRLESLIEKLIPETGSFDALVDRFTEELTDMGGKGISALKSIVAYRTGLEIERTPARVAAKAYEGVRDKAEWDGGKVRIASKPILDYLILTALEMAAEQGVPVQVHTALGDPDVYLLTANPLQLRSVLQDDAFKDAPIVLLHCWPYLREAAYLSNLYGNVHMDLSMTLPMMGYTAVRGLEDVLGIAPASKLLYGSDAPGLPDYFWLGAVVWRQALGRLLGDWTDSGGMPAAEAEELARLVLHENAEALYGFAT